MKIENMKFLDLPLITHRIGFKCIANAKSLESKRRLVDLAVNVTKEYMRRVLILNHE